MDYFCLRVISKTTDAEILSALLSKLHFESFQLHEDGVSAYLPSKDYSAEIQKSCEQLLSPFDIELEWTRIEYQNWNETWESNFSPVAVGDFCRVRADFHEPSTAFKYEILLYPEMAFGTGHHETTFMMIERMQYFNLKGKIVLDFGCGTGVLAILAKKMGSVEVHAIDNDQQAIHNTHKNALLNDQALYITMDQKEIDLRAYDCILANINKNTLLDSASWLSSIIQANGDLLLSGIMIDDLPSIVQWYEDLGFRALGRFTKGEWACLHLEKL